MFYRYKDEVVNLKEVVFLGKDFLLNAKTWLIRIMTKVCQMSMKFPDMAERDKVFEEIYKKMEKMG